MTGRSPIEIMINQACGVPKGWTPPPAKPLPLVIRCPVDGCGREKPCRRLSHDPKNTAVVVYPCPAHGKRRAEVLPRYLDTAGAEIEVQW